MTQAAGTDFASYGHLSESEQGVLEQALASIPDDILSTGDRQSIESRIRNRLQREGVFNTEDAKKILQIGDASRALGCLAASYVSLRGISNNQPAEAVAGAIARMVSGCVPGGADAIKADLLRYRSRIGCALEALGLPALRDALLAGELAS